MKNKILLVDDTPFNLDILIEFLDPFYELLVATDGKSAIDIAKLEKPDLILLDIQMPEMDGFKVCTHLKKDIQTSDIPIIFLTVNSDVKDKEKGFSLGAVDYILKPFNTKEVEVRVKNHINLYKTKEELREKNIELNDYKNRLEEKVRDEVSKRQAQEKALLHQSKLAAMGEMVDAIAHQWKQPLTTIQILESLLVDNFQSGVLDQSEIKEHELGVKTQIKHLVNTIDEFRSFMRPDKEISTFKIFDVINFSLLLMKDDIRRYEIHTEIVGDIDASIEGIENEFKHVIINLIDNAKDSFLENCIKTREIIFTISESENSVLLQVLDNAGGIKEDVMHELFKPNVTTKADGKGSGIGLYMSELIIKKIGGTIGVENINSGAQFNIEIEKTK